MSPHRCWWLAFVFILLTGCGGGTGGNLLQTPAPLLSRLLDQPYEWDSELSEDDWVAWIAKQPQPDRPLRVVTSVPEVWVVVKYTGREALASLYPVMPFTEPPQLKAGEEVRVITAGTAGIIKAYAEGNEGAEVEIDGKVNTYKLSELEYVLNGAPYETFDINAAKADAGDGGRKAEALAALKDADLVVLAGAGIDDWMAPLISESGTSAVVVDLSRRMNHLMTQRPVSAESGSTGERNGVKYATAECNAWWMSLRPTSVAVDSLDMLIGHMVPGKAAEITGWRTKWLEELGGLDQTMATFMLDDPKLDANSVIPRRVIIDTPNLAWFCYRWDMQIVDIINTDSHKPPSPERIREIQRKAQEQYVSMIITTAGYGSDAARQIANGLTIEIMERDPNAPPPTKTETGETKEEFNPNAKTTKVPVPVVELALGLNQAGRDTEDYVPFMLFNSQKLARKYKPIVDGLYRLKKWHEEKNKLATTGATTPAPAPEASTNTPAGEGTGGAKF